MPKLFSALSWEVRDSSYFILGKKENILMIILITSHGFPSGSVSKEYSCNSGDLDSVLGLEGLLEKGTATHSSMLVWRMPWTEGPGRLQFMVPERVAHPWINFHFTSSKLHVKKILTCPQVCVPPGVTVRSE